MIFAEILAGGSGTRMGAELPKQFLKVAGKPIIIHTIEKFLENQDFDRILIVINPVWLDFLKDLLDEYFTSALQKRLVVVEGGAERNESLFKGLDVAEAIGGVNNDNIIVTHDAVRPFLTNKVIADNIEAALEFGCAGTVLPAIDTIAMGKAGRIYEVPDRKLMFQVQTPQSFNITAFRTAYAKLSAEEVASLTEATKIFTLNKLPVINVSGMQQNFKITTPFDMTVAQAFFANKVE